MKLARSKKARVGMASAVAICLGGGVAFALEAGTGGSAEPQAMVDTARLIAEGAVGSSRLTVGPGAGELAAPGELCLAVEGGRGARVAGCSFEAQVKSDGLAIIGLDGTTPMLWGYVPAGVSKVEGGGGATFVQQEFFAVELSDTGAAVTVSGRDGKVRNFRASAPR